MKHEIPAPNLSEQFKSADQAERREQVFLAFEAEYDVNRPFEVQWGPDDRYFSFNDMIYIYKPQFSEQLENGTSPEDLLKPYVILTPRKVSESPHLIEFVLE